MESILVPNYTMHLNLNLYHAIQTCLNFTDLLHLCHMFLPLLRCVYICEMMGSRFNKAVPFSNSSFSSSFVQSFLYDSRTGSATQVVRINSMPKYSMHYEINYVEIIGNIM